ncbi:ferredoxin reductase [Phytohabitans suffuscus]|uniref:Ferredoxin reductase n=1 Tax=Phytohabitans suffuscus TaxID=624315 RepID=A0A6F8YUK7_9ACTN|nr:ferredoxin reductase [Phytohabitans suffuscus]
MGAGLAGLRTAEALRREGWAGGITVVGEEVHMPYTRPPLSKRILLAGGGHEEVALRLRPSTHETRWLLGRRVAHADLDSRLLTLGDGTKLPYDGLVVATGVRPRRLPASVGGPRAVLRTIDDAAALSRRLSPGARVAVIGAGFIGCEVAAAAIARGCRVTVVALDRVPMRVPLGTTVGEELRRRHRDAGVDFRLGTSVTAVDDGGVVLADGARVDADVVVEAIGSAPATGWLEGNGLDLTDGVVCDGTLRVQGRPGVVAVGDVARFPNALYDPVPRRIEHWQTAVDTSAHAAATLVGDLTGEPVDAPFGTVPTFWSDQGVVSVRSVGQPGIADEVAVLEGDLSGEAAVGYRRDGQLVGVVLLGMPKSLGPYLRTLTTELASARG